MREKSWGICLVAPYFLTYEMREQCEATSVVVGPSWPGSSTLPRQISVPTTQTGTSLVGVILD